MTVHHTLTENLWGSFNAEAPVCYHADGPVGRAIRAMAGDALSDLDGQPLGDALGRIATDVVMGRRTAQAGIDAYRAVLDRLPTGGNAHRWLAAAIADMDADNRPAPKLPAAAPPALHDLVTALNAVPLARADTKELDIVVRLAEDYAAGRTSKLRLTRALYQARNMRHESLGDSGKFEIDRAVSRAVKAIQNDKTSPQRITPAPACRASSHDAARTAATLTDLARQVKDGADITREDGERAIDGLSKTDLAAVAAELGLAGTSSMNTAALKAAILNRTVAGALKYRGLREGASERQPATAHTPSTGPAPVAETVSEALTAAKAMRDAAVAELEDAQAEEARAQKDTKATAALAASIEAMGFPRPVASLAVTLTEQSAPRLTAAQARRIAAHARLETLVALVTNLEKHDRLAVLSAEAGGMAGQNAYRGN